MNIRTATIERSPSAETVQPVIKLGLIAAWIVGMLYLVSWMPGIDRLVPQTPVTFAALLGAIVSALIVVVLMSLASEVAKLSREVIVGPRTVIEHISAATYWFVMLTAVLVAYRGFAGVVTPFVDGFAWMYDVLFLTLALPVVVLIGARLYVTLEPSAEVLAAKIGTQNHDEPTEESDDHGRIRRIP